MTVTGPTGDLDVAGVNVVFIDTSSNNVTLSGFTNGVNGQVINIAVINISNNTIIEDEEGDGNQDIFLNGGDITFIADYGGVTLACNGTSWFEVSS